MGFTFPAAFHQQRYLLVLTVSMLGPHALTTLPGRGVWYRQPLVDGGLLLIAKETGHAQAHCIESDACQRQNTWNS